MNASRDKHEIHKHLQDGRVCERIGGFWYPVAVDGGTTTIRCERSHVKMGSVSFENHVSFTHDDTRQCYFDATARKWFVEGNPGRSECVRVHPVEVPNPPDRGQFGMPTVGGVFPSDLLTHPPAARIDPTPKLDWAYEEDDELGRIFLPIFPRTMLAKRIVARHAPAAFEHFIRRNNEYGEDNDFNLGSRGQYVDISRKVQKLKRYMWDGQEPVEGAESKRVIIMELIGHLFMTLDYLDQEENDAQAEGPHHQGECD